MTLDEFVAEVCERLRADMQMIRHPDGDIHPFLFHFFEGERISRMKIPRAWFDSRQTKDAMAKAIERATVISRPRMIAFVTTTYVLTVAPEDVERVNAERAGRAIADIPGREEMVSLIAFSRDEMMCADCLITRDGVNPPAYGEWRVLDDLDHVEGAVYEPLQRGMRA